MISIVQQPDSLSLLGNIKKLIVRSTATRDGAEVPGADITVTLISGGSVLQARTYSPDGNSRVEVDLHDVLLSYLSFLLSNVSTPYRQPNIAKTFSVSITDGTDTADSAAFTVVRAGVDRLADTPADFLTQNFMTWQPSTKGVTYYTPEFLTYYNPTADAVRVRCQPYVADASQEGQYTPHATVLTLATIPAGQAYTIPVGYAVIAAALSSTLPAFYDVWVERAGGGRLTYIQRYYAQDMRSEEEQWILFENSLGGIDTFRAYGDSDNKAEHKHNIAEIDDEKQEYRVDTERKFQKHTGRLDKYERRWLLDFFPSLAKYIYTGNYLRQIVVTESDVSYKLADLPSSYTFTYQYADAKPYLNIPRAATPDGAIVISIPDLQSFTVAPRLVEFPRIQLSDGALFLAQDPYSEGWGATTFGAISEAIRQALATHYLSRVSEDTAQGHITFLNGLTALLESVFENLTFTGVLKSQGALEGMDGRGIFMSADDGKIQAEALDVTGWMRVAKLVYNMIQVMEQDYQFSGGGDIERVEFNEDGTYTLHFHKEKSGRHIPFADFDILYGKVDEQPEQGGAYQYWTSWMRVCENGITLNSGMTPDTARVELWEDNMVPGGRNFAPRGMMTVAKRGNTQDANRQSLWELSTTDERITYYWHVDQPMLRADNYALCLGILPPILDEAGVLPDTRDPRMPGLYVNTIFYENAHHIYYPSLVVKEDRGEWTQTPTATYTGTGGTYTHDGTLSDASLAAEVAEGTLSEADAARLRVVRTWEGTYTEGQAIGEPYHFEGFSRNMWLTHRLSPSYRSLSDLEVWLKMAKEWRVDKETSRAWRYGALWECLVEGTAQAPELGCSDWTLIQQPAIVLQITATKRLLRPRDFEPAGRVGTTLGFVLQFGGYDMTADIVRSEAVWTRQSVGADDDQALAAADTAWNQQHRYGDLTLGITKNDLPANWATAGEVQFTLTVTRNSVPLGSRRITLH